MKKIILTLITVCSILNISAQKVNYEATPMEITADDKLAIVMVHFGSSSDAIQANYNAINEQVADLFNQVDIFEAYSSRIIIKKLRDRGINKLTPLETLEELSKKGYTHIVVQSTHIIDGVEMESLRRDAQSVSDKFKDIRVGNPLLYTPDDYSKVIEAMVKRIETKSDAVILVGHGTYTPITASYSMMDYMLKLEGYSNWHVGTVEGYPSIDEVLSMVSKQKKVKSVTLVPFMYIAGTHAVEDIAGEWCERFEDSGYRVELLMEGMGENPEIRAIFVEHIEHAIGNKHLDIMDKKQKYIEGK